MSKQNGPNSCCSRLTFVCPLVDADPSTSCFMTEDFFGIRAQQSASDAFVKFGMEFELRTGVHLSKVGWHSKN